MEEKQLTPEAQQARDEILEHLMQGHQVRAIRKYMQASGKQLSEAKSVIDRLGEILDKPGLDAAEKTFLAGFRASLNNPERPSLETVAPKPLSRKYTRVVRPNNRTPKPLQNRPPAPAARSAETTDLYAADGTPTGPPGVRPVLLHVLLAQLVLNLSFVLFSVLFGVLGYLLNLWVVMVVAMVAGVALFMLFPVLLDRLFHRLGLRRQTRTPGLLFDFGLGMALLLTGLWGGYTVEQWIWHQRAELIPLTYAEQLADKPQGGREIYVVESLPILSSPAATHSDHKTRSSDKGGSYINHWHVRLVAGDAATENPCLWFGWRSYTGRSGVDDPLPPWQSGDHYVIVDDDRHYRKAVQSALGRTEAPTCTTIVNRIPSPAEVRDRMEQRLLFQLVLSATLPWLLLLVIASYTLYRRIRPAQSNSG